jgi:hypothetical protein
MLRTGYSRDLRVPLPPRDAIHLKIGKVDLDLGPGPGTTIYVVMLEWLLPDYYASP